MLGLGPSEETKSKKRNLGSRGKPTEIEASLETGDGSKETSLGDVEFGGDRLKPRVVSLVVVVVEETNGCWVPFESRISESIHL